MSTITTDSLSLNVMIRKAINTNGHLGSLYDGRKDVLFIQNHTPISGQRVESSEQRKCVVRNGNLDVSRDILQIIDVEDDLRLNLLLEVTKPMGIVEILNDSYRINEHTRLLYYSWRDREEQISNEVLKNLKWNQLLTHTSTATHVITGINYGIDVIVILNSSSELGLSNVDRILQKINSSLSNGTDLNSLITTEENNLLLENIKITVYSNIRDLTGSTNISELLHRIDLIKNNSDHCHPITYSLQPLDSLHYQHTKKDIIFRSLPSEVKRDLEKYMLHKRTIITILKSVLHRDVTRFFSGYLEGRVHGVNQQRLHIVQKYDNEKKRLAKLVIEFRSGQTEKIIIDTELKDDTDELVQITNGLKTKADLISRLRNHHVNYCNAVDRDIDRHYDQETIRAKLTRDDPFVRILCSDDTLNKNQPEKLSKLLSDLIEERQRNHHLRLIYADFSYCSYKFHNMLLMSSNHMANDRSGTPWQESSLSIQNPQSSVLLLRTSMHPSSHSSVKNSQPSVPLLITRVRDASPVKRSHPPPRLSSTDEIINIVLLGETGVGKSTFINAFANYLKFNSLAQAISGEPIVVIPVSFLITVGENFEERTVKFGEINNNENFNEVGQSVTQHCQSYVFDLQQNGKKLRIIDTPGYGDTRGPEQDDQNMEHILKSISRLTHLNAICFLLKPNSSRLNMFFRTCLTRLFSLLAPAARQNVIFCFTNARSTFYTPGDTVPLLKAMLADSSLNDIPFQKENTFCLDSESFRYLVALRNRITFTEEDEREYQTSWSTSVKESQRLIDHIQKNMRPYYIQRK